jgi:hypothetical protein
MINKIGSAAFARVLGNETSGTDACAGLPPVRQSAKEQGSALKNAGKIT